MFNLLKKLITENKNVCIHANSNDTTGFIYGRILCVDEKYFAIYMFSCDGEFDGILVKQIEDIVFIETGNQYEEKMQRLLSPIPSNFEYDIDDANVINSMLCIALQTQQIVSLELVESGINDVVGFVRKIDDNICTIEQVDSYGIQDSITYIKISDISQISYASKDEIRISKLYSMRQREIQ